MAASASRQLVDGNGDKKEAAWPPVMDRYERLEKVGKGTYGAVYKAWDTKSSQIVAVKRLSGRGGDGFVQSGIREFAREVMCLAACRGHPWIVQLRETFADNSHGEGDAFIAMEYVGRLTLKRYMLYRRVPFSEDEVRRIMRQLLEGVKAVHETGLLHRDITPENVLIDDGSEDKTKKPTEGNDGPGKKRMETVYKICDFGMSLPTMEEPDYPPEGLRTTDYSAPELFLRSREYDGRVDTWGLGCIMAELLAGTGTPMFHGESNMEVMGNVLDVVGAQGIKAWPGFKRLATDPTALMRGCRNTSRLRELFPDRKKARRTRRPALSSAGFEVLNGLLESNPEKRLTAADALQKRWFNARRRRGFGGCFTSCVGDVVSNVSD